VSIMDNKMSLLPAFAGQNSKKRIRQNANRLGRRDLTRFRLRRKREAPQIQWSINNARQRGREEAMGME
jgi:hypothetical protein